MGCINSAVSSKEDNTSKDDDNHIEEVVGGTEGEGKGATRNTYRKKAIPKRTRDLVWLQYNGRVYDAKCFCCDETLDVTKFEAGHIKSERTGGETTIQNLVPICGPCNRSMGTENMIEFATRQGYKGRIVGHGRIHLNILP
jgi:hypothetical protein